MLKIENLTKSYGEKKAVDALSLHIQKGEIYGFIGHNGAGKSTTIKSIVGAIDFEQGDILINSLSIKDISLTLKISCDAVKKRLERARKMIKDMMEDGYVR